ncbi:MAG: CBS domain-containing protein [Acidobacteria bacterium]|nr:CBS domain-containing protein [Acidobacteriota bacterium]
MLKKESILDGLLQTDWKKIRLSTETALNPDFAQLLYMQAIADNARNGYSIFQRRRFPNVSVDDIVSALKKKPEAVKTKRQKYVSEFFNWLEKACADPSQTKLVDTAGNYLFDLERIGKNKVFYPDILKGIYLWCSILSPAMIRKAEKKFDKSIGYGAYYLVDMQQLGKHGINADDLEHFNHDDMIDFYRDINLITNPEKVWKEPEGRIKYLFIRHSLGSGLSKDLAIVLSGIIYSIDVAYGILLAQIVHSMSKYVHQYNDYLDDAKNEIKRKVTSLELREEEILDFLNMIVNPDDENRDIVPTSTILELFTADKKSGIYPLESYLAFIQHKPTVPTYIGRNRILSLDFFRYINKIILSSKSTPSIPTRDYIKLNLNLPAKEYAYDDYVVIRASDPISKGINKMITTRKDVLIIVDDKGKLQGVLSLADIVRLFEN